jgi:hypothetical protein
MSDDIPPLPEYAAELAAEEAFGPFHYTPDAGVRIMNARIAGLLKEMAEALGNDNFDARYLQAKRARIIPLLREARRRRSEYQFLLKSQN